MPENHSQACGFPHRALQKSELISAKVCVHVQAPFLEGGTEEVAYSCGPIWQARWRPLPRPYSCTRLQACFDKLSMCCRRPSHNWDPHDLYNIFCLWNIFMLLVHAFYQAYFCPMTAEEQDSKGNVFQGHTRAEPFNLGNSIERRSLSKPHRRGLVQHHHSGAHHPLNHKAWPFPQSSSPRCQGVTEQSQDTPTQTPCYTELKNFFKS